MKCSSLRRTAVLLTIALGVLWRPAFASAQAFGIGPRLSFVRGTVTSDAPAARFLGGTIRMVASKHTVFEAAMDYRAFYSDDKTQRVRETPLQGSILLFPVRGAFSPYVGGGIGIYTHQVEDLGNAGIVVATTQERKMGWHLGAGLELKIAPHASFFADYRFRFVQFGTADLASEAIPIPGSSIVPGLDRVHLTHEGSMWTSGVAFYF
jgi:Outer membrane protein beta-barrel domain